MLPQNRSKTARVMEIFKRFQFEYAHRWQQVYEEIDLAYNFLAGHQYSRKQIQYYDSFRRPTNVFNLILPKFNIIAGDMIGQNIKNRVYARPGGRPDIAEIFQDLVDHYHIDCDYDGELLKTMLAACCRVGYLHTRWSDERERDGSLISSNLDEYEVLYDSRAEHPLLDDADYTMRFLWMDKDDLIRTWPEHRRMIEKYIQDKDDLVHWDELDSSVSQMIQHKDIVDEREGKYRVIEYHGFHRESADVLYDPQTGYSEIMSLEGRKRDLYMRMRPNMRLVEVQDEKVKKIEYCIPGMAMHLEEKLADLQDRQHDIVPVSAYPYAKRTIDHFGMYRNLAGPQRNFNQYKNQSEHLINKSASVGAIYKPSALENPEEVRNFGSEPGLGVEVKEGYDISTAFKEGEAPKWPFPQEHLAEDAERLLDRIATISPSVEGLQSSAQEPAALFAMKVKQGLKAMQIIYHQLRRANMRIGQKEIGLLQKNLTRERYYLITNPQTGDQREMILNVQYGEMVLNDITVGKYQVFADMTEKNPIARTVRFLEKTELAKFVVETWGPTALDPHWWLKDADLDDIHLLADRIEQSIQGQMLAQQEAEAMAAHGNLLALAQQKQALEQPAAPQQPAKSA